MTDLRRRTLTGGRIDIWEADLDDARWRADTVALTADEHAQSQRLPPPHGARFSAGRRLRRLILAAYVGCGPNDLAFATSDSGKPSLAGPTDMPMPHFNVAHSGVAFVMAVAAQPVGIDIERANESIDIDGVAALTFDETSRQRLRDAAPRDRHELFLNLWTQHEAVLKLDGGSLGAGSPARSATAEAPSVEHARRMDLVVCVATRAWRGGAPDLAFLDAAVELAGR